MSKQSFKGLILIITAIVMFNLFSNLFATTEDDQLPELIKKGAFLVDVRTPAEFADSHVPGSINIPLDKISSQLDRFKGKENIVVFCRSGNRSSQAKSILERNGFKNVINGGTYMNVGRAVEASKK
jgi:rhodanese-related sulfurtransferase